MSATNNNSQERNGIDEHKFNDFQKEPSRYSDEVRQIAEFLSNKQKNELYDIYKGLLWEELNKPKEEQNQIFISEYGELINILKTGSKMPNDEDKKIEPSELATEILEENYILTFGERQKDIARYVQDSGIWRFDGRSSIERWIQNHIDDKTKINTHLVNETIAHIERETGGLDRSIFQKNDNPHIVLENGVLNLETLEFGSFRPDLYSLNCLPVRYDPDADCPVFKTFISEVLPEQDVEGVQEELGAILRKRYLTKKFSIYLGDPNTGKTTLISVFLKFLGRET